MRDFMTNHPTNASIIHVIWPVFVKENTLKNIISKGIWMFELIYACKIPAGNWIEFSIEL